VAKENLPAAWYGANAPLVIAYGFISAALCEIAPHIYSLNLLFMRMKGVIEIGKLIQQIMRQAGAVKDEICLHDRKNGIAAATRFGGQKPVSLDR